MASFVSESASESGSDVPPSPKRSKSDKKKKGGPRKRNWCFTIFTDPQAWLSDWETKDLPKNVVYMVAQLEVAPDTKREHVQGYCQLNNGISLNAFKELIGRGDAHVEPQRGTDKQAADYCKKEESYGGKRIERGEMKKMGNRTDLAEVAELIKSGAKVSDVAQAFPKEYIRYHGGIKALSAILNKPKHRGKPRILYIWGPPGCGKSRYAFWKEPDAYAAKDHQGGWFCNYDAEECVVFDDFRGNFPLPDMLRLLDRYKLQQQIKGSHTAIYAKRFIFTSNHPPEDFYGGDAAWLDRIRGDRFGSEVVGPDEIQQLVEEIVDEAD